MQHHMQRSNSACMYDRSIRSERWLRFTTYLVRRGFPCPDRVLERLDRRLLLDRDLVAVQARPMKPFQGWRYLDASGAPPDLAYRAAVVDGLPDAMRRELQELCLI